MNDLDEQRTSGAGRWAEIAKAAAAAQRPAVPHADPPEVGEVDQDVVPGLEPVVGAEAEVDQTRVDLEGDEKRRFFSTPASPSPSAAPVNPLLPGAPVPVDDEDGADGAGLRSTGLGHVAGPVEPPVAPAPTNPALLVPASWPAGGGAGETCSVQVVGLHGGAGTSTLTALIGPEAADCGHGLDQLHSIDVPVLFVTRSHARGLDLALRMGQQYASRSLDPLMVLGVVVVDDAPSLSKGLARTLRSVEKTLPNCWHVSWDEDLRHDPGLPLAATRGRLARDVRRIVKKSEQLAARKANARPPGPSTV